jgi:hypothetical protein
MTIKAVFDGFDTIEQAKAFIDWYSLSGEQHVDVYLEEWTDLTAANVKNNVNYPYTYTEDKVTCNLELYYKENNES